MAKTKKLTTEQRLALIKLIHLDTEIWHQIQWNKALRHLTYISPFGPWWEDLVYGLDNKSDKELLGICKTTHDEVVAEEKRHFDDMKNTDKVERQAFFIGLSAITAILVISILLAIWIT